MTMHRDKSTRSDHVPAAPEIEIPGQTAVRITAPGGPEVLRLATLPVPVAGPGEVLIKVAAAGVNRHDCNQRRPPTLCLDWKSGRHRRPWRRRAAIPPRRARGGADPGGRLRALRHRFIAAGLGLASEVETDPKAALRRGLKLARQANASLLVTGSLYPVGAPRGEVSGPSAEQ